MYRTKQIMMRIILFTLIIFPLSGFSVGYANANRKIVEFPVGGNPLNIIAESPERVWYTLPEDHAIGLLVITGATSSEARQLQTPTEIIVNLMI